MARGKIKKERLILLKDLAPRSDPKGGAAGGALNLLQFPTLNHQCEITSGVRLEECRALLQSFFAEQRQAAKAKKNGENQPP